MDNVPGTTDTNTDSIADVSLAPAFVPYDNPNGLGPDAVVQSGAADVSVVANKKIIPQRPQAIPHLPVIIGGAIFVIVLAGVLFAGPVNEPVPILPVAPAPVLINGQSSAAFHVDYGNAGMYAAYTPEQKIVYSAGTNAPAQSVSWVVCNNVGKFIALIPLAMQENTADAALKARRWKSSGAPAFMPGKYQVTVRAESMNGDVATQSFFFDPIRGVDSTAPGPECKVPSAGA